MNKTAMHAVWQGPWRWLALCLSMAWLVACGGGGDAGGADQTAGVGSGGTGSFSSGTITEFGSIVVNGIHFDQTKAEVKDADGLLHPYSDLKLGMSVQLDASSITVEAGKQAAKALFITYSPDLLGPIDAVGTDSLTVMGQTVRILKRTHLDESLSGGLSDLKAGDVIEVYGFHDAGSDTFVATRVARPDPVKVIDHYVVRGVIRDLTPTGCRIGKQKLAYIWPSKPGLRNGRVATAQLYPFSTPTGGGSVSWQAQFMTLSTPLATDRDDARVEGLVTELIAGQVAQFSVNGVAVDASRFNCTACVSLQLGDRVSVKGPLVEAVVTATEVTVLPLD